MEKPLNSRRALITFLISVVVAILIIVSITSCVITKKQKDEFCKNNCTLKETTKDSSSTKETPYDTLALIKRHQGKDHTFQNCDSLYKLLKANNDTLSTKQDGIRSTITREKNGGIKFRCETDSLLEVLRLTRLEKNRVITTVKEVPARCEKRHMSDWDIIWMTLGKWESGIIAAVLAIMLLRIYLKKTFPGISKIIP